jgi:hypothetical protein
MCKMYHYNAPNSEKVVVARCQVYVVGLKESTGKNDVRARIAYLGLSNYLWMWFAWAKGWWFIKNIDKWWFYSCYHLVVAYIWDPLSKNLACIIIIVVELLLLLKSLTIVMNINLNFHICMAFYIKQANIESVSMRSHSADRYEANWLKLLFLHFETWP